MNEYEYNKMTQSIINCAFKMFHTLGSGFLEKVYENALVVELKTRGYEIKQQYAIKIYYKDNCVGDYIADIMVNNKILIELKVVKNIDNIHIAQLLNYLKATNKKVGLILNFYKTKVEIKRMVNNF